MAALYRNELEKIFHRATTWILLGVMVLGIFAMGGLMRAIVAIAESQYARYTQYYDENGDEIDPKEENRKMLEEYIQDMRSSVNRELAILEEYEPEADPEAEMTDRMEEAIASLPWMQADLFVMELCLKYDIDYFSGWYYYGIVDTEEKYDFRSEITSVANPIARALYSMEADNYYRDLGTAELMQYALALSVIEKIETVLDGGDYQAWLDLQLESLPLLEAGVDAQESMRRQYEMLRVANPEGKINPALILPTIQEIALLERSLDDDVEYKDNNSGSGSPLTDERRQELTDKLAVAEYRLENQSFSASQTLASVVGIDISGYSLMKETGAAVLAVLVLMLAGSAIAQEVNTGSIKALIIAPVRRWKILTAKILAILTATVGGSVLMLGSLLGAGGIFFPEEFKYPYVYASGGVAHALPFVAYRAAEIAVDLLPLLCWLMFALMISTAIRNTAAAVGVSLGGYFLSSTVGGVLMMLPQSWGMRFLPFAHLNLSNAVFSFASSADESALAVLGIGGTMQTSALFSALYLVVMCICFGWTAYDSFCRRDLK